MSIGNESYQRSSRFIRYVNRQGMLLVLAIAAFGLTTSGMAWGQGGGVANSLQTPATESPEQATPVWKVQPAAEPSPALRYRFWPDRFEMRPGNAFVRFQRAILIMKDAGGEPKSQEFWDEWETWMDGPLEDLPVEKVQEYLNKYSSAIEETHSARLLRDTDYELGADDLRGIRTISLLLPEFQEMRALARILSLQVRLQLAEGKVDDAIETLQVGFRMGEATGQAADFLISRLVGIAITGIMLNQVETCIQQESCPNLYWALATIPPSSSETHDAVQFESTILARVFPAMSELPEDEATAGAWRERLVRTIEEFYMVQGSPTLSNNAEDRRVNSRLLAGLAIVALSESSRAQLVNSGMDSARVAAMSPEEAVVRATAESIRRVEDDYMKWSYLPDAIRREGMKRAEDALMAAPKGQNTIGDMATIMAGLLMPAINAASAAGERTEQNIARLITVEAIRNHVALHQVVPESLAAMAELPAWPDPKTGKMFGYEKLSDRSAKLTWGERWSGDEFTAVILEFEPTK